MVRVINFLGRRVECSPTTRLKQDPQTLQSFNLLTYLGRFIIIFFTFTVAALRPFFNITLSGPLVQVQDSVCWLFFLQNGRLQEVPR